MTATRTTNKANAEMAQAIEHLVKREIEDHYGYYMASDDTFDLTEDWNLVLVNGVGDCGFLPIETNPRHATLIAAAIYLRDGDS